MVDMQLVGRCGLYCGACNVYRAQRDDPEWRRRFAERFNCTVEQVRCEGCGGLTPDCWGFDCKILKCLRERGYEFCCECPDYEARSCEKHERIARGYAEDGVDMRANLAMIKEGKLAEWLEAAAAQYTCKFCGGPTTEGAAKCHHCGREIVAG